MLDSAIMTLHFVCVYLLFFFFVVVLTGALITRLIFYISLVLTLDPKPYNTVLPYHRDLHLTLTALLTL